MLPWGIIGLGIMVAATGVLIIAAPKLLLWTVSVFLVLMGIFIIGLGIALRRFLVQATKYKFWQSQSPVVRQFTDEDPDLSDTRNIN